MTKGQFADLVSSMRAYQKLHEQFGERYELLRAEYEEKVDEAIRNIICGIW